MNINEWIEAGKPWNVILHGDCMDLMKHFNDKEIPLCITDPPYINKFTTEGCISNKGLKGNYKTESLNNNTPDKNYFKELKRISKNQIIWGVNYYNCFDLSGGRIVWDKNNTGNYSDCELAYQSFNNSIRKFKYTWNGMIQENMGKNKEGRFHPTQKPIALYRWLLQNYAKPGDKIIDTHSGSGSLACACFLEGFDFLAIEKDVDYYNASVQRYETLTSQGRLFI